VSALKEHLIAHRQYLLTGVSHAVPFIACGGILIALAISFAPMTPQGPDFSNSPTLKLLLDTGVIGFKIALPVLAGYIAYAMVNRPGLVPGMVGGFIAGEVGAGFLGALLIGLFAGHIVKLIKKLPVPKMMMPVMPIIIIPLLSSLLIGLIMYKVIGVPIAALNTGLGEWLKTLNEGNAVVLAAILGAMIAFDMGGPVNKAAFFFGAAMIKEGHYTVMGACAAAICTPPLGMGLATLLKRNLWTTEQRESGLAAFGMGLIGITEGAIPFAAADPVRVIPCIMGGSMLAAIIAMSFGVGNHAPHGGPIVLPVIDNPGMYIVAIIAGSMLTALSINVLKKTTEKPQIEEGEKK
jgi:fructose PTS system EIIBC or EIIC component